MNDMNPHTPRPEFRHALEQRLVTRLQRETRYAPVYRVVRNMRMRSAVLIALGAVLGVGCGYASAQVRESQVKSELLATAEASLRMAELRVAISRERAAKTQQMFQAGVITSRELVSAESELREMEVNLAQAQLDIEEIQASAAPPRRELWAPLVDGRDFVKRRLELEAAVAQQRLTRTEAAVKERERMFAAKVITSGERDAAQIEMLEARQALDVIARRLELRRQFVEGDRTGEAIAFDEKFQELQASIAALQARVKTAEQRLALAREREKIGAAERLEVLRADLDLVELQSQITTLSLQLQQLRRQRQ